MKTFYTSDDYYMRPKETNGKAFLVCFLLIVLFLLTSCEKQEEIHCWICETKVNNEVVSRITACGISESEIADFREGIESGIGDVTGAMTETICTKK